MSFEIDKHSQDFAGAAEDSTIPEFPPWSLARKMSSSLAFGYLKLESDSCLKTQYRNRDANVLDFLGVSFADVKEHISSMQELGEWKVCTVPIADRMPMPIAIFSSLIPIVGVGLHNEGLHAKVCSSFKDEIGRLIREIESEGWGIDLDQID